MRRITLLATTLVGLLGLGLSTAGTAAAQQPARIAITAPAAGATVSGPVTVAVDISGVTVKAAGEGDPNAYHYHLLVDVDPASVMQRGQPLPLGQANIIHTADRTVSLPNLGPGPHTITVVLTKTDHVPLGATVQDQVRFTVTTPAQAQPTPAGAPAAATPDPARPAPRIPRTGVTAPVGTTLPAGLLAVVALFGLSAGAAVAGRVAVRTRR